MFLDSIKVNVKGGTGGSGACSFRREKWVEKGGPDGGNGGRGGNVYFISDISLSTFNTFRFKNHFEAENGVNGSGSNCYGRKGKDFYVSVPCGTLIKDSETGIVICDLKNDGDKFLGAKGGRGGKGNSAFKSSVNQVPRLYEKGEPGVQKLYHLELKLIADVGLVGLPNGGKSTLLSRYSNARPKIADYPFTTTEPMLGMVNLSNYREFVIADIPGLIEGAHQGHGLGDKFLKHVERTRILLHVIDFSSDNIIENFEMINNELNSFSSKLVKKKMVVACNKMDLSESRENYNKYKNFFEESEMPCFPISGVSGEGLEELGEFLYKILLTQKEEVLVEEASFRVIKQEKVYEIVRENETFIVTGPEIEKLSKMLDLETYDGLRYFKRKLEKMGIFDDLRRRGIENGMTVKIYGMELLWV